MSSQGAVVINEIHHDPPQIRQVAHHPALPVSRQRVRITAKITDLVPVSGASLHYQAVDPGNYIERTDPAYETAWTDVAMNDAGVSGDETAGDSIFTAVLPGDLQNHRRLVRYRVSATHSAGQKVTVPSRDDPAPNFAYFVYDGVPSWSGAIQPNSSDPARRTRVVFTKDVMRRLPVYHLIAKAKAVQESQYGRYGGDQYRWAGTLVYDGQVYDHIHFRARGGVWRYAMGKNMWKFDFNRGHRFEARDNFGKKYRIAWDKLNLGACIQQADYLHRGEQGMFESVGFRLFNLAGVESPHTHFVQLRVIDDASEADVANQYAGDFWGLYLAVEQEDGRFLEEHQLPDGNLYKMEGGTGELNSQGPTAVTDKSDLNAFLSAYRSSAPADAWWRSRFDLARYYSYQTIVQGIHHYDICYGKNYFYYLNPLTDLWSVHPWDLDLTWADNMYDAGCGGTDDFKNRVLQRAAFKREYQNRIREIRDLLFNTDQLYALIDEYAAAIHDPGGGPSFVDADRAMWDYHPIMASSLVNPSKSGQGRFYQVAPTKDFAGMVNKMKSYVVNRSRVLDRLADDTAIPSKPAIQAVGPANYPLNQLRFRASNYSGSDSFAALQWRVAEVTPEGSPAFDPARPRRYEIEPVWDSEELAQFASEMLVPSTSLKVGHTYRARVRMKDRAGRWSHWSDPVQFMAGQPDTAAALIEHLRLTELMYDPGGGADFEFVELHNASASLELDLSGTKFTQGIDFTMPAGTVLSPGSYLLVVKTGATNHFQSFRSHYGLDSVAAIVGPFAGSLANEGERLTLKTASAGAGIVDFSYGDGRGWPRAADGPGHSLVPLDSVSDRPSTGALNYPGNWRASSFIGGSPGRADPPPPMGIVLNEFAAETADPASLQANDWIELFNPTTEAIQLADWYLSDDGANLKRWAIPRVLIQPNGWVSFDQAGGLSFGLDRSGEQIFLSHLPGGDRDRVADSVAFKAQERNVAAGRFPDGSGSHFVSMEPSRGSANKAPLAPAIVISEIMYHPSESAGGGDSGHLEYIELFNPGSADVPLSGAPGGWRLDGGVRFSFPTNTTISARGRLLVVNFSPTNTLARDAFLAAYNLRSSPAPLLGPYGGSLDNSSDRVAIEKPQMTGLPADPTAWILVDEMIYSDQAPWAATPDGTGHALHRVPLWIGNDPNSWRAGPPSPGSAPADGNDQDNDGLPDDWERANGLNPDAIADATEDPDNDGMTNLREFTSGTDPRDPDSVLKLVPELTSANELSLRFTSMAGKRYVVQYRESLAVGAWKQLADVPAQPQTRITQVIDFIPEANRVRFYRVVVF